MNKKALQDIQEKLHCVYRETDRSSMLRAAKVLQTSNSHCTKNEIFH